MDVDAITRGLDAAQAAAVTTPSPLLAVIAGAGSGKTSVLTRRVAHRVATGLADAQHTMVLTFTRQAAGELRRRLRTLGLRDTVAAGTFHAMALGFLRQHWADSNRPPPTVVNDRARLVAEVLSARTTSRPADVSAEIDWARARLVPADQFVEAAKSARRRCSAPPAVVARAYADYEQLKRRRGIVDLDDLLSLLHEAAAQDREFAEALRWRVRHLYVDEAQDLNPLQARLLELWRAGRDDLTIVGDPAQAIYGFTGSDPTLLVDVGERFPGVEIVRLNTNYRCTPEIVAAGRRVLAHATPPPPLHSSRPEGAAVRVVGLADEREEAASVARLVRDMRRPGGRWSSVAVLARTNAQLPPILDELARRAIPARLGSRRLTPGVADAVADAAAQPSAHRLSAWAHDVLHTPLDATSPGPGADHRHKTAGEDSASADRRRVAAAVIEFLEEGGGDGRGFAGWVRTTSPFTDVEGDAVELCTFHAAKGREWASVVVCGAEAGLLPHGSATTNVQRAEEARLAYVAITRAADQAVITWAASRDGHPREPSPYLHGLTTHDEANAITAPPPSLRAERKAPDPRLAALAKWRQSAARVAGIDPVLVLPDAVLAAVATRRPTNVDELAAVSGVGQMMANRFGPRMLEVLAAAAAQTAAEAQPEAAQAAQAGDASPPPDASSG